MHLQQVAAVGSPTAEFSHATGDGSRVTLAWSTGEPMSIPLIWLRDNCLCNECRIVSTGEHRYFLGTAPELPTAGALSLIDGTLAIDWTDGHSSRFTAADLERLRDVAARTRPSARFWHDDFMPARFHYADVLGDPATLLAFLQATVHDGMTIITSVPTERGECARFLDAIDVPVRDTPFDRVHDVHFHTDGYNVAHTDEPLPPHNDFASYHWPPSGQLIHMLVNEVAGGEWVNVDGWKVIEQLRAVDPAAIDTLARVPVAFREHSSTAESWTRQPLVRLDPFGNVVGLRFSNQLMQPLDPTGPDVEAFYHAYHRLALAVTDPANQIEFRGNAGDMQVLHGHRILHARRGFDGASGSRHLQDTYFEFDDIASLAAMRSGDAR